MVLCDPSNAVLHLGGGGGTSPGGVTRGQWGWTYISGVLMWVLEWGCMSALEQTWRQPDLDVQSPCHAMLLGTNRVLSAASKGIFPRMSAHPGHI